MAPFTYPSMKAVLIYMDPNLRIELARKIPATRTASSSLPAKMNKFELTDSSFKINNRRYRIGVVRHYPAAKPPQWVYLENSSGGVPYDVTPFAAPNDFKLRRRNERDRAPSDEENLEKYKWEQELAEVMSKFNKISIPRMREKLEFDASELRKQIQNYNEQSAISQLKFVHYLQLSIFDKRIMKYKERLSYSVPVNMALTYFTERILGWKEANIQTNNLEIVDEEIDIPGIFKIKVTVPEIKIMVEDKILRMITFTGHQDSFRNIINGRFKIENRNMDLKIKVRKENLDEALRLLVAMSAGRIPPNEMIKINGRTFPVRFEVMRAMSVSVAMTNEGDYMFHITRNYQISL